VLDHLGGEYRSLRILPFAISVAQVAIGWFPLGVPYYVTEALELGFRYAFAISVAQVAMGGHPLGGSAGPLRNRGP
jgi:hypothetical protein